jgi:hypothetical protein
MSGWAPVFRLVVLLLAITMLVMIVFAELRITETP